MRNGFEAGKIHYEGHWKGWAMEIETFLGPEMGAIWAQKIQDKLHIKNRHVGNLMYKGLIAAVLCVVVCRHCYGGGADLLSPSPPPPTVGMLVFMHLL